MRICITREDSHYHRGISPVPVKHVSSTCDKYHQDHQAYLHYQWKYKVTIGICITCEDSQYH